MNIYKNTYYIPAIVLVLQYYGKPSVVTVFKSKSYCLVLFPWLRLCVYFTRDIRATLSAKVTLGMREIAVQGRDDQTQSPCVGKCNVYKE